MLHILICDDQPLHIQEIQRQVQQLLPEQLAVTFHTAQGQQECFACIRQQGGSDWILLMDIVLQEEQNGIEIARQMQQLVPNAQLIFITGYIDWCTKAGRADPIYFLTKPLRREDLQFALQKALCNLRKEKLFFSVKGKELSVRTAEILYAERNLRQTHIHTLGGETLQVSQKIEQLEQQLDPVQFASPHKSFLVNLQFVSNISAAGVQLENGETLPISHLRRSDFKKSYLRYAGQMI